MVILLRAVVRSVLYFVFNVFGRILDTITYKELVKNDAEMSDSAAAAFKNSPLPIFVG